MYTCLVSAQAIYIYNNIMCLLAAAVVIHMSLQAYGNVALEEIPGFDAA